MFLRHLFTAAIFALSTATAQATVVDDGDTLISLTPVTDAAAAGLGGSIVFDTLSAFTLDPGNGSTLSGNVQSRVIEQNGTGNYIFAYRIRDLMFTGTAAGNDNSIQFFGANGFAGFLPVDVFTIANTQSSGDTPIDAIFEVTSDSLNFTTFLTTPNGSTFLHIVTTATHFTTGNNAVIGGNPGGDYAQVTLSNIAAPALAPIPLPAGGLLLLAGLGGFVVLRRKSA